MDCWHGTAAAQHNADVTLIAAVSGRPCHHQGSQALQLHMSGMLQWERCCCFQQSCSTVSEAEGRAAEPLLLHAGRPTPALLLAAGCVSCRDVSEEIRAIVIEAIGSWIVALPTEFLADTHLEVPGLGLE